MEMDSSPVKLCYFCCFSFQPEGNPNPKERFSTLHKLCSELNQFYKSKGANSKLRPLSLGPLENEKLSVCSDCLSNVNKAMNWREKAGEVELIVSYLQKQILGELGRLQEFMNQFYEEMRKVEEAVKHSDQSCLAYALNEIGDGGEEVDLMRKGISEVFTDLQSYRGMLDTKFSGGGNTREAGGGRSRSKRSVARAKSKLRSGIKFEPQVQDPLCSEPSPLEFVEAELDFEDGGNDGTEEEVGGSEDENYEPDDEDDEDDDYCDYLMEGDDDDYIEEEDEDFTDSLSKKQRRSLRKTGLEVPQKRQRKGCVLQKSMKRVKLEKGEVDKNKMKFVRLSKAEVRKLLKSMGIDLSGMSELKKGFVVAAVRRMKIRDKIKEHLEKKQDKLEDKLEEEGFDDYWYRKKYIIEYNPETGISLGGITIIINEEEGALQCTQCSYSAPLPESRSYHEARNKERNMYHHILGTHLKAFTCAECVQTFKSEWRYRDHMRCHRDAANVCDICGRPMSSTDSLLTHKLTHMSPEEKEEARKSGKWKPRWTPKPKDPNGYLCPENGCEKKFNSKGDLDQHMETHQEVRDIVICPECGKSMLRKSYDIYHKKYHCPGRELCRVPCTKCDQTFKNSNFLRRHMARVHCPADQLEAYQCEVCGKGFKSKDNLSIHQPLHNTTFEFRCKGCGKEFCVKRYWRRHEAACVYGKGEKSRAKKTKLKAPPAPVPQSIPLNQPPQVHVKDEPTYQANYNINMPLI